MHTAVGTAYLPPLAFFSRQSLEDPDLDAPDEYISARANAALPHLLPINLELRDPIF